MADRPRQGRADGEDGRARRDGALRRRRGGFGLSPRRLAVVAVGALLLAGCPKEPPPPPPAPPPPPPLTESAIPPTGAPAFKIDFEIEHAADPKQLVVVGTVRNTGSRATKELKVWVEAVDAAGARVVTRETFPEQQEIAPGDAARFRVLLPNDPAIRTVRVEAFGK